MTQVKVYAQMGGHVDGKPKGNISLKILKCFVRVRFVNICIGIIEDRFVGHSNVCFATVP